MRSRLLLACLLAAVPAAASDYSVELRFENGGETRTHRVFVPAGESRVSSFVSSGTVRESLIASVLLIPAGRPGSVELQYLVEWDRSPKDAPGLLFQAQDASVLAEGEQALLTSAAGWRLWGRVAPREDRSCAGPGAGGGLRASVRIRDDGRETAIVRRTGDGTRGGVLIEEPGRPGVAIQLEPALAGAGRARVRYSAGSSERPAELVSLPMRESELALGEETRVEGSGKGDGVWIRIDEVPYAAPAVPGRKPPVPDPATGWLRHPGPLISFLYPPGWELHEVCDESRVPNGWNLYDASLPRERRMERPFFFFTASDPRPLAERVPGGVEAEAVAVRGGECRVWREPAGAGDCPDPAGCGVSWRASAACESGGKALDFVYLFAHAEGPEPPPFEGEARERYETFKRVVGSLSFNE